MSDHNIATKRTIGRRLAEELKPEEQALVSGGLLVYSPPTHYTEITGDRRERDSVPD